MIIAQRDLRYRAEDGTSVAVPVTLHAPQSDRGHWKCPFTIGWPNGVYSGAGYGVDQMQALVLSLQMIGVQLYASDYHATGRLFFEAPGRGYGFPVPANMRPMLVGDDRDGEA